MEHAPEFSPIDAIRDSGLSEERPKPASRTEPAREERDSEQELFYSLHGTLLHHSEMTDQPNQDSVRKEIPQGDWQSILDSLEDDRFADKGRAGV